MSQFLINDEPLKVLLLAEEKYINSLVQLIPNGWDIVIAQNIQETNDKIDNSCALILIDSEIIGLEEKKFFSSIQLKNNLSRIVLLNKELDTKDILQLFNQGNIHRTIDLEGSNKEEIESILLSASTEFKKLCKDMQNDRMIQKRVAENQRNTISHDRLLDLSLKLSESTEIKDFTNQFVSMIDGIQSFLSINFSIYQDVSDEENQKILAGYLSDLELLANQYDQRILMIYVEVIRSYFSLLFGDIDGAMEYHRNCVRIFYWLSTEYLDKELVEIINDFPLMEDDYYYIQQGEKEYDLSPEIEKSIVNKIKLLLSYDIHKLTNISETLYKNLKVDSDVIQSILVVRDSLPLFVFQNSEESMDSALVSGFVDALSSFLQELIEEEGDIDHIQHDNGIILIHREEDLRYLLVAKHAEVYLRMGLRQFAKDTVEQLQQVPVHSNVTDEEYILLKWKIEEYFKL